MVIYFRKWRVYTGKFPALDGDDFRKKLAGSVNAARVCGVDVGV